MSILRRKKLKKHINTISYMVLFMVSAMIISVAGVSGKDKAEYRDLSEKDTYIVDVESETTEECTSFGEEESAIETIPTAETTGAEAKETEEEVTTEKTPKKDQKAYKGVFIMNTSGNLNIRSKADRNSEVVGILREGNGGNVVKYGKEWSKINSGKVVGYVATEYILIGDKAKQVQKENGSVATVKADTLMVREGRSVESPVIGMAAQGEQFRCEKIYSKWIKIKYNGNTGYISRDYVKVKTIMTYAKSVEEIEAEQATEPQTAAQVEEPVQTSNAQKVTETVSNQKIQTGTEQTVEKAPEASYNDKYLLACLVTCEAGGESYEAKLAVANVVLNRVRSSAYPGSVKSVIYQSGQFGPVSNSSLARALKNGPDSGSAKAAEAALSGTNNVPGYLFFGGAGSINTKNLKSYRKIDSQIFY